MLDEKDMRILEQLKRNSKLTSQQISRETLIPITTVHNRIKKMTKTGIIRGYSVILDNKKLGYDIIAFIMISVNYLAADGSRISQEELAKNISRMPRVVETHIVTGGTDIIAKIRVHDIGELNNFVTKELRNIDGVENTETMIVLETIEDSNNANV